MRASDGRRRRGVGADGVAHLADAPLATLSAAAQRVHLAQALAWRADLLILDEPTAGLDVAGIELLDAAIRAECERGTAVVVCTHDIRDALEADRALLLAGRVVAYGPPAETLTRDALLETFGLVVAQLPAARVDDGPEPPPRPRPRPRRRPPH